MIDRFPTSAIHRAARWILVLLVAFLAACDEDAGNRQGGVISTGNTARVIGIVAARSGGLVHTLKLVTREGRGTRVVDSTRSDSAGRFRFDELPNGSFWVEAWQGSHLVGASSTFSTSGGDIEIVIAVVDPLRLQLDLRPLGNVDSVFVDYPENPGARIDSLWSVTLLRDSGAVLNARIRQESSERWTEWIVFVKDGKVEFLPMTDLKALPFLRKIDTSVFSVDRHTMALWSFDSLDPRGLVADQGPFGLDLECPRQAILDPSPHGKALRVRSLVGLPTLRTRDAVLPAPLRWARTGEWSMQVRLKLDSLPQDGFQVAGPTGDPLLTITQGRAFGVYLHLVTKTEAVTSILLLTRAGVVPIGKWIDVVMSVDARREEVYLWMDGQAQDLIIVGDEANGRLREDSTGSFVVGGLPSDSRRGDIQVDEIRISDTLVLGRGFPRQPALSWVVGAASEVQSLGLLELSDGRKAQPKVAYPLVGRSKKGDTLGRYLWKPSIPGSIEGREVVFAMAYFFDQDPPVPSDRTFAIHEILKPWSVTDPDMNDWMGQDVFDDIRVATKPRSLAPLLRQAGTGGILFDVTTLVKKWVDDPKSRNGLLLRSFHEDLPDGRVIRGTSSPAGYYSSGPGNYEPALVVYYR